MAAEDKAMRAGARIHIGQVKEEFQLFPVRQVEMEAILRGELQRRPVRRRAGETPPKPHIENGGRRAEIAIRDRMQPGVVDQASDGRAGAVSVGEMPTSRAGRCAARPPPAHPARSAYASRARHSRNDCGRVLHLGNHSLR